MPDCWCANADSQVLSLAETGYDREMRTPRHERNGCPAWHTPTAVLLHRAEYIPRAEAQHIAESHAEVDRTNREIAERELAEQRGGELERTREQRAALGRVSRLVGEARRAGRKTLRVDDVFAALKEEV